MADNKTQLSSLEQKIEELYEFRDNYFNTVPEESFGEKNSEIESKLSVSRSSDYLDDL